MSIHEDGINDPMSFEATARNWVITLEGHEARLAGVPLPIARRMLSRKIGISPGTLENIRRGRLKGIRRLTAVRIKAFMIRHLQSEIRRHIHDLSLVDRGHEDACDLEILEAEAAVAKARELIGRVLA